MGLGFREMRDIVALTTGGELVRGSQELYPPAKCNLTKLTRKNDTDWQLLYLFKAIVVNACSHGSSLTWLKWLEILLVFLCHIAQWLPSPTLLSVICFTACRCDGSMDAWMPGVGAHGLPAGLAHVQSFY